MCIALAISTKHVFLQDRVEQKLAEELEAPLPPDAIHRAVEEALRNLPGYLRSNDDPRMKVADIMRMAKLDNKNRFELLVAAGTQRATSINQTYWPFKIRAATGFNNWLFELNGFLEVDPDCL